MFIACMGSLRCIHMMLAFLHMHLRWPYIPTYICNLINHHHRAMFRRLQGIRIFICFSNSSSHAKYLFLPLCGCISLFFEMLICCISYMLIVG